MSDAIFVLFMRRNKGRGSYFVFPAESKTGYIIEPQIVVARVIKNFNVHFNLHDSSRTFATVAESLDLPAYARKRLFSHKSDRVVTADYIM